MGILAGCASPVQQGIGRFHRNSWEYDWGYANEVRVGNLLYISGICSYGDSMDDQVRGVYSAVKEVLAQHKLSFSDVVKENVFTTDMEALKAANATRLEFYDKDNFPGSTWVEVERLFEKAFMLEVELVVLVQ